MYPIKRIHIAAWTENQVEKTCKGAAAAAKPTIVILPARLHFLQDSYAIPV
jgi:hypothetical protein